MNAPSTCLAALLLAASCGGSPSNVPSDERAAAVSSASQTEARASAARAATDDGTSATSRPGPLEGPPEAIDDPAASEWPPQESTPTAEEVAVPCRRGTCFDAACLENVKRRFPDICIWPHGHANPDLNGGLNPCIGEFTACP